MIEELRALIDREKEVEALDRTRALLDAVLGHQGLDGPVYVVAGDVFNAERLAKIFVTMAKERGLSGTVGGVGRKISISPTVYRFVSLGEDGTLRGVEAPRFISHDALVSAIGRLIRETAGPGSF